MTQTTQKCSEGNNTDVPSLGGTSERKTTLKRFRNFVMTVYGDPIKFDPTRMKYLAYGYEPCPTTGRMHYQTFICMINPTTARAMSKRFGCWSEQMYGSLLDNDNYCSKKDTLTEFGTVPEQGKRNDLIVLRDQITHGAITAESVAIDNPIFYHQYGRTLHKIEDITRRKLKRTWMTEGIWFWGPTGTGKTHKAYEYVNFDFDKVYNWVNDNGWWDTYEGQEVVLINDFRGSIPYGELLNLIDKWPYSVRRRCREPTPFLAKTVIITSPMSPEDVYHNLQARDGIEQLLRRLTRIEYVGPE